MWLWLVLLALLPVSSLTSAVDTGYWLSGPKGHYFLFGRGKESWVTAREYCLTRNSDLISVDDSQTLGWLLSHVMPGPKSPGTIQVGLFRSFYPLWRWLDGKMLGQFEQIYAKENDQCGVLSLKNGSWLSVGCEDEPEDEPRFVCERTKAAHEEQQKSDNGLWIRLERLFEYFGITGENNQTTTTTTTSGPLDLEDPGFLAEDIKNAERMLDALEGSGSLERTTVKSNEDEEGLLPLNENERSGIEAPSIEGSGHEGSGLLDVKTEKKLTHADAIEQDFNVDDSHINIENVPLPDKKDDCLNTTESSKNSVELLSTLRRFLDRAAHVDLQRLVEDDSHSMAERLLRGISAANKREFTGSSPKQEEKLTASEKEMLFNELGKLFVSEDELKKTKETEDFL